MQDQGENCLLSVGVEQLLLVALSIADAQYIPELSHR